MLSSSATGDFKWGRGCGGRTFSGLRIVDLSALAPGPYCSMLFADLGAEVISVQSGRGVPQLEALSRGKKFITLNLKSEAGIRALHAVVRDADVLLEGFRPGVAARLGAGYRELQTINPGLVYCSLTGFGQHGKLAQEAGHDLTYLAASGVLGCIGPEGGPPQFPLNLLADLGAGSLLAAFGIAGALFERSRTGKGAYVDAAMIDGCYSMLSMHVSAWGTPAMPGRGDGLVSGGAPFYRCYVCSDGRYVSVAALERPFFQRLWTKLGLGEVPTQYDRRLWPAMIAKLATCFASEPLDHWTNFFEGADACVFPVLNPAEAAESEHFKQRFGSILPDAPVIPRFGDRDQKPPPTDLTDRTDELLGSLRYSDQEIAAAKGAAAPPETAAFRWPPVFEG